MTSQGKPRRGGNRGEIRPELVPGPPGALEGRTRPAPAPPSTPLTPDGGLTPVGESEFARDRAFGFAASHLPAWVEEKTLGQITASEVGSLRIIAHHAEGPEGVFSLFVDQSLAVYLWEALEDAITGFDCST